MGDWEYFYWSIWRLYDIFKCFFMCLFSKSQNFGRLICIFCRMTNWLDQINHIIRQIDSKMLIIDNMIPCIWNSKYMFISCLFEKFASYLQIQIRMYNYYFWEENFRIEEYYNFLYMLVSEISENQSNIEPTKNEWVIISTKSAFKPCTVPIVLRVSVP